MCSACYSRAMGVTAKLLIALLLAAALASCGPRQVFRGESLTYLADDPKRVCAGTPRYLERYTALLRRTLGLEGLRIRYYWLRDIAGHCRNGAGGCSVGARAYSLAAVHPHEIAHAIVSHLGHPSDFLVEGLAEVLGGDIHPRPHARGLPGDLPTHRSHLNGVDYGNAGRFVGYLIERYGVARVLRVYRSEWVSHAGDAREWARKANASFVRSIFGRSPPELVDDFHATAGCSAEAYRAWLVECEAATPWVEGAWEMERTLECRDPATINENVGTRYWSYGAFDVPADGRYTIELDGRPAIAIVQSCAWQCPSDPLLVTTRRTRTARFRAGRYFVHVRASPAPADEPYRVVVRPDRGK